MRIVALVGAAPALIGWFLYSRTMNAAAAREFARQKQSAGMRAALSADWVAKWTRRGGVWGGASMGSSILGAVLAGAVEIPDTTATASRLALMACLLLSISTLSGAWIGRRSIEMVELAARAHGDG